MDRSRDKTTDCLSTDRTSLPSLLLDPSLDSTDSFFGGSSFVFFSEYSSPHFLPSKTSVGETHIRNRGTRWASTHVKIIVESLAEVLSNEIRKKDLFEISDSLSTVAQKQQLSISSNAIVRGIDQQHFTSALFFPTFSRSRTESDRDLSLSTGNWTNATRDELFISKKQRYALLSVVEQHNLTSVEISRLFRSWLMHRQSRTGWMKKMIIWKWSGWNREDRMKVEIWRRRREATIVRLASFCEKEWYISLSSANGYSGCRLHRPSKQRESLRVTEVKDQSFHQRPDWGWNRRNLVGLGQRKDKGMNQIDDKAEGQQKIDQRNVRSIFIARSRPRPRERSPVLVREKLCFRVLTFFVEHRHFNAHRRWRSPCRSKGHKHRRSARRNFDPFLNRSSIVSRIDQSEWKNSSRSSSIEFERVKTFPDLLC